MKISISGQSITLNPSDFLASGGEGDIYVKSDIAYKIYHDAKKVIPQGKFTELSVLNSDNIVKPDVMAYMNGSPVGYQMRFIKKTSALCQLFTSSFKSRNKITPNQTLSLVRNMADTLKYIHSGHILVVDLNELNCLADEKFSKVYFIDVDSWQTRSYPATAIMESVRDYHQTGFNEASDWFSFAVVTFQMLIGIHPYRGRHPHIKNIKERMQKNISVFHSDITIPASCMPLNSLPPRYRSWYEETFENGLRDEFPCDNSAMLAGTHAPVLSGGGAIRIYELYQTLNAIASYGYRANTEILCCEGDKTILNRRTEINKHGTFIIFHENIALSVIKTNNGVEVVNLHNLHGVHDLERPIEDVFVSNGRLYGKYEDGIYELIMRMSNGELYGMWRLAAKVMPKSTHLYQGVAIQNMIGAWVADLFPDTRSHIQIMLPQLDKYVVHDAMANNDILIIMASAGGKYYRFMFSLSESSIVQEHVVMDVPYAAINFVRLDRGIAVLINEDECIEVFQMTDITKRTIVNDNAIHGGMKLVTDGASVMAIDGNRLLKISMGAK